MDSQTLVLVLIGIIGAVSLFGGYRLARLPRRNDKQLRFLISVIIAVILAVWFLYDRGFFDNNNNVTAPTVQSQPTPIPIQSETLTLNEATTYSLAEGEMIALSYTGELGQVATLTLKPESGDSPAIVIMRGSPPAAERSIRARGLQTIICGYQWEDNETVTFSFQATATTTYTVEFVDGNTCRGE